MNNTWIAILGGVIATVTSSFVSWFFAKRKYNAEVDHNLIKNMQESLEFYKKLSDDTKERLDEVLREKNELRKEVDDLRNKLAALTSTLAQYGLLKLMEDNRESNQPEEQ